VEDQDKSSRLQSWSPTLALPPVRNHGSAHNWFNTLNAGRPSVQSAPGCAAIVDQDDKNVIVLVRCKGQIDWVVWAGRKASSQEFRQPHKF
jgi:hypothetical protein